MRGRLHLRKFLFAAICTAVSSQTANAQVARELPNAPVPERSFVTGQVPAAYTSPSESTKLHNYYYEAFGPYPLVITAFVAGYHQARHNPPDWREGFQGYDQRYASDFGISALSVSARYALAEAADEDVYYYRCNCTGIWPRLRHAVVSVVIARNQVTGRPAFALPGVVAPYVGPFVAPTAWYPNRYGPKDAFRMGNYGLLDYTIGNIGLEFLSGPVRSKSGSLIKRFHLENRHLAPHDSTP